MIKDLEPSTPQEYILKGVPPTRLSSPFLLFPQLSSRVLRSVFCRHIFSLLRALLFPRLQTFKFVNLLARAFLFFVLSVARRSKILKFETLDKKIKLVDRGFVAAPCTFSPRAYSHVILYACLVSVLGRDQADIPPAVTPWMAETQALSTLSDPFLLRKQACRNAKSVRPRDCNIVFLPCDSTCTTVLGITGDRT